MRVISVDPKQSTFTLRMKCTWRFRTLNTEDRTETHLKVPGLRMPNNIINIEESRIWRDLEKSTQKTLYWRGVSIFNIVGFEMFEMSEFPFDRQVINLELMEFVWRDAKHDDTFAFSMNVVFFRVTTESMTPEWVPFPAKVRVEQLVSTGDRLEGPTSASRFKVKLLLERKVGFFVIQIFFVTLLITLITTFPLALPAGTASHVGTRLSVYGLGILTLVAYKYGISDSLPKVPYHTYTDKYLVVQVLTIVAIAVEALVAYELVDKDHVHPKIVKDIEMVILVVLVCFWIGVFVYAAYFKKRTSWETVFSLQENNAQKMEEDY